MSLALSSTRCPAFHSSSQAHTARRRVAVAAQASSDPLLQKPVARPAEQPSSSEPAAAAAAAPVAAHAPAAAAAPSSAASGVTIEYQRQQAKAMRQYFQNLKLNETVEKSKVFGWTRKNEINNGRWVMFGLLVGMMTEYSTGVSFIDQLKLMASYMGLVDLD